MVNKKGEGVRGVLGDLVSRDRERREQPPQPAPYVEPVPQPLERSAEPEPFAPEPATEEVTTPPAVAERVVKKATGIKGRPRVKKDKDMAPQGEKVKVTLSIETTLRDQFYLMAHGEMMQPGEFVERALRYYIKHHSKRD